jgi:hypothetical protein
MALQITSESISGRNVVFDLVLEDFPGGCQFDTSPVPTTMKWVEQGTPVYLDKSTRIAVPVKTVKIAVSGDSTNFYVEPGHFFKVADVVYDATSGAAISAIVASGSYDKITVGTALVTYTADTVLIEGSAAGSGCAAKYTPNGFVKDTVAVGSGSALYNNIDASIVIRGAVRNGALPYPLTSTQKTSLAHFTFNA